MLDLNKKLLVASPRLPRPFPKELEGALGSDPISQVALSIFVWRQSAVSPKKTSPSGSELFPPSLLQGRCIVMKTEHCTAPGRVSHVVCNVNSAPGAVQCGSPDFLPVSTESAPIHPARLSSKVLLALNSSPASPLSSNAATTNNNS